MKVQVGHGDTIERLLRQRGVPEERLPEATRQVVELNQLRTHKDIRSGATLELPDVFQFGDETVELVRGPSAFADLQAKAARVDGRTMGTLGIAAFSGAVRDGVTAADLGPARQKLLQTPPTGVPDWLEDHFGALDGMSAQKASAAAELLGEYLVRAGEGPKPKKLNKLRALQAELIALAGDAGRAPGAYALPGGGKIHVEQGGEFLYEPPVGARVDQLEKLGFAWVGESDFLTLPKKSGPDSRLPGYYELPGGTGLNVHVDGSLLIDPGQRNPAALEAAGFSWAGESGMLEPPEGSGSFRLPGGGKLQLREDGEALLDPGPLDPEGLENQGFTWAGESDLLALPKMPGAESRLPGEYPLPGGTALFVHITGEVLLDPRQHDTAALEARGFSWAGESGLLNFPGVD